MPSNVVPSSSASNAGPRSPTRGSTQDAARGRGGALKDTGTYLREQEWRRSGGARRGGAGRRQAWARPIDLLFRPHGTGLASLTGPATKDVRSLARWLG